MSFDKFTSLTPELHRYLVDHGSWRDEASLAVEAAAERTGVPQMQMAADQAAFMTVLARACGAREALEVGTFMGYGAIAIARALPDDGSLLSCELDAERAAQAREHIAAAGLAERVEVRVGPALETLRSLPEAERYDFSFIDADKRGYPDYYEEVLARTRPGGLLLIDNTLMDGRVLDPGDDDSAAAVAALNDRIASDERVDSAMVGIADGVTVALKR